MSAEILAEVDEPELESETAETVDERPAAAPQVAPGNGKPGKKPGQARDLGGNHAPLREVKNKEELEIRDWLNEMGGAGDIKVLVNRKEPETFKGVKTNGAVRTYFEPIDIEMIRKNHGGGTYQIRVMKSTGGKYTFEGGSKVVHIPGNPRIDNILNQQEEEEARDALATGSPRVAAVTPPGLADKAFQSMADQNATLLQRALTPQAQAPAVDVGQMTRPFELMIDSQQKQIDRLMATLANRDLPAAQTQKEKIEDTLLGKFLEGDSVRITALEAKYESELRTVRENHRADMERAADRWDRERDRLVADHARAADMQRQQGDLTMQSVQQNLGTTNAYLQREVTRLERERDEARKELGELRAKKDKSPLEIAKEFESLREVFGSDEDGGKTSGIERVATKVIESPIVQAIAEKVMNNMTTPQQAQPPQQQIQVGQPFRGQDGQIYVHNGQEVVLYRRKKKKRAIVASTPETEGGEGTEPGEGGEGTEGEEEEVEEEITFDEGDVKIVIGFLEAAYGRQTPPETMADSIKTQVPANVVAYIGTHGVDRFLDNVARLPKTSPLAQQGGRNWVRKLAKALVPSE